MNSCAKCGMIIMGTEPSEKVGNQWQHLRCPTARDLVSALRGGIPAQCGFCGQERSKEELHPEEAGMWICIYCIQNGV